MTQQTVWDLFRTTKFRLGALFLIAGAVGVLVVAVILKVPLGVSLVFMLFVGAWGVVAAFLELIVRAVANSRAPITFRPREPFEFIQYSNGFINVAHIVAVVSNKDDVEIWQTDGDGPFRLEGAAARQMMIYLTEISTPLAAMGLTEEA